MANFGYRTKLVSKQAHCHRANIIKISFSFTLPLKPRIQRIDTKFKGRPWPLGHVCHRARDRLILKIRFSMKAAL